MELTTENISEVSRELQEIATALAVLEANNDKLIIGVDEIMKMTGWSRATVRRFMNRPDFPLIKQSKELQVNKLALVKYTMQRIV